MMSPAHSSGSIDLDTRESPVIRLADPSVAPDERGSRGIRRQLLTLLVIVSMSSFVTWMVRCNLGTEYTADRGVKQPAADRAVPVITATVQQKTMPIYANGIGNSDGLLLCNHPISRRRPVDCSRRAGRPKCEARAISRADRPGALCGCTRTGGRSDREGQSGASRNEGRKLLTPNLRLLW